MSSHKPKLLLAEALQKLTDALAEASASGEPEPNRMSLATADTEGKPAVRTIFLADVGASGPLFFINSKSGKGLAIASNPNVALCFFWPLLKLQVIVEGVAQREEGDNVEKIWSKRGRAKQLVAWASQQLEPSQSPGDLQNRVAVAKQTFSDQRVPLPEDWTGIRVIPTRIEFWSTGWDRLKNRVSYQKQDSEWIKVLLDPLAPKPSGQ